MRHQRHEISTKEELEEAVLYYGMLPFFSNNIPGFSIEEMAAPGMLFGGSRGEDGCWEWKGPVIQQMTTAYGKFFRRKAGFVAMALYPDFINFRRNAYILRPDSIDSMLLDIIIEHEGLTAAEMRRIVFGSPYKKRTPSDLVDLTEYQKPKRQVFEPALQRLQMGGRLLIADFEYKYSNLGERYGWGEALYTTPEIWFGGDVVATAHTPRESFELLAIHLKNKLPHSDMRDIVKLLS